jgi:hypothetical protein
LLFALKLTFQISCVKRFSSFNNQNSQYVAETFSAAPCLQQGVNGSEFTTPFKAAWAERCTPKTTAAELAG